MTCEHEFTTALNGDTPIAVICTLCDTHWPVASPTGVSIVIVCPACGSRVTDDDALRFRCGSCSLFVPGGIASLVHVRNMMNAGIDGSDPVAAFEYMERVVGVPVADLGTEFIRALLNNRTETRETFENIVSRDGHA